MQISATRTLPENRNSSTSEMLYGTEWGPAFCLQDSQSSFCPVTFISHKLWENIHAVLVIGYSGPTSDLQVTHGNGDRGGTGRSFWTIEVVPPPGIQIFQQGTCPNLFSKNSRNQDIQIFKYVSLGRGHFHSSHQIVLFFSYGKKKAEALFVVQVKGIAGPGSFLYWKHQPQPCESSASAP